MADEYLNYAFADDINLMEETVTEAQDILTAVHLSSQKHGLEINKENHQGTVGL